MESLFEILLELVLEIIVPVIYEMLFAKGVHGTRKYYQQEKVLSPVRSFIGYAIFGALLGGLSLFIFPDLLIGKQGWSVINLVVAPIIAGFVMSWIGYLRKKKEEEIIRLESFLYGWGFAFTFALVRFLLLP